MSGRCERCWGCGQLANTEDREPWTAWSSLPVASAIAVIVGFVKPIPCDLCGGTGLDPTDAKALDVEKHLDPSQVFCANCKDRGWVHKTLYKHRSGEKPNEIEGATLCTTCFKVGTEEAAKTQHALVCGCERPWINLDLEAGA